MAAYLIEVSNLVAWFAQLGCPKPIPKVNDCILSGLGDDWEPLCLTLAPTINAMTTNNLASLLLNQEAK